MPRLIALYNAPDDPDAFDAHYRDVHAPIVARYPNLRDVRLTKPVGVAGPAAAVPPHGRDGLRHAPPISTPR